MQLIGQKQENIFVVYGELDIQFVILKHPGELKNGGSLVVVKKMQNLLG